MKNKGLTLIELVIGVAALGIISVIATGLLFFGISLRDQTLVAEELEEGARVLDRVLRVINVASTIEGGGTSLRARSGDKCLSLLFDGDNDRVLYQLTETVDCQTTTTPANEFLPEDVSVDSASFSITESSKGGYEVRVQITLSTTRPLASKSLIYDQTFTSFVDR